MKAKKKICQDSNFKYSYGRIYKFYMAFCIRNMRVCLRSKWEEIPVTWPFLFGFCIFCLGDAICDMLMWSNLTNQTTYKYIISPYLTTTTSHIYTCGERANTQDQSHVFLVFFFVLVFVFFCIWNEKKIYVINITGPRCLHFCQVLIGQNKILGKRDI